LNPDTAKRVVLVSVALMAGAGVLKSGATFSRLWAAGAVGLGLAVLADFAPTIAGPLAALVAIGYLAGAEDTITSFVHGGVAGSSNGVPPGTDVNPRTNPKAAGPPAPQR
jgi:hypothetical protein